ncbi:MAG: peptidylprolyl isomerase [Marinilabiliales bacterium]|nr:MAG: peptidylprolyl isomerase [Marinilabiliales bacterium]
MKLIFQISVIFFFIMSVSSCLSDKADNETTNITNLKERKESLEKVNKYLVRTENESINNYIRRHNWEMTETGSGLRIGILQEGSGQLIKKGDQVSLEYETRLITGDLIYSSENDGLKTFIVGYGDVESGLEEAILLLRRGSEANLIIPSHLAFGLLGDQKRIPSRSSLIYKIKILNNNN